MVKFKSRYLLIELKFENEKQIKNIETTRLIQIIKKNVQICFGDLGLGKINKNLQVKYVNNYTNLVIIRVGRDHLKLLWTVLSLINTFDDNETVKMHILKVSGTIKKCEQNAREMIEKWLINYENI